MRAATVIGALAIAVQIASPRAASADEIVGVLHLETEGVSETAAEKFESSIEEGLSGPGYRVAPRKRLKELLANSSYIDGCHFGPCLNEVYRNTKVRMVLVGRIVSLGPSYSFVVSLLDTRTGRSMSQVADLCDVCTLEEAIATATLAVVELVTKIGLPVEDSGDALPADPKEGTEVGKLKKRVSRSRRMVRRAALFFLSAAALAGGAGAYLLASDKNEKAGCAAAAAGGAFAVTSVTLFTISRRF